MCLFQIERLQAASDRESALVNMLNNDPWLDARLCEAVKLLMLVGALELKVASDKGQPLPLFAELLFARDTSSTPNDLMHNHLRHVGDTAGLEQVGKLLVNTVLYVTFTNYLEKICNKVYLPLLKNLTSLYKVCSSPYVHKFLPSLRKIYL